MIAMRGYPKLFFKRDASTPAVNAPINAAAAGGNAARSTSSSLNVLAMAPITAADAAKGIGLLNIIEKPNTPPKLASNLRSSSAVALRESSGKLRGFRFNIRAIIHAVIVATTIITMA